MARRSMCGFGCKVGNELEVWRDSVSRKWRLRSGSLVDLEKGAQQVRAVPSLGTVLEVPSLLGEVAEI